MSAALACHDAWAPTPDPFWASFQPVSFESATLLARTWGPTSDLDFYRSPALLGGIAHTSQLRFARLVDGTVLLAARGFLGTERGSFSVLEPQGSFAPAAQRELLDALSRVATPVQVAAVSEPFLARHGALFTRYAVREARDLAEYIYRLDELAALEGHHHQRRRRAAARVAALFRPRLVPIGDDNLHVCEATWQRWLSAKVERVGGDADTARSLAEESCALSQALPRFHELGLFGWLALVDDRPVAMSICEHLREGVVGWRFTKGLREPRDLQCFLEREMARMLLARGYTHWNWDVDAGVIGLRERKLRARPCEVRAAYLLEPRRLLGCAAG